MRLLLFLVAVIALLLQPQSVVEAKATAAFLRSATTHKLPLAVTYRLPIVRGGGGAATDSDDESESTSDDDDEESESEPEQPIKSAKVDAKASSTLTTSALQKLAKNDKKATTEKLAASKQAVNVKISAANKKKNSVFKGFWLRVPYIVRASMNPVTAYRMTVAYWASLVNLDYGKQVRIYVMH
jgi:hypothetical protein